jgi:hypothetical protein
MQDNFDFLPDRWPHWASLAAGRQPQPQPMDIFVAKKLKWGYADYDRPVLILEVRQNSYLVAPLSTKMPKFNPSRGDFMLDNNTIPGVQEGFICGEHREIPKTQLNNTCIGHLSGEALQRFMKCCM